MCQHIHTSRETPTHIRDIKRLASLQLSTGACVCSPVSASGRTDQVCTSVSTSGSSLTCLLSTFFTFPLAPSSVSYSSFSISSSFISYHTHFIFSLLLTLSCCCAAHPFFFPISFHPLPIYTNLSYIFSGTSLSSIFTLLFSIVPFHFSSCPPISFLVSALFFPILLSFPFPFSHYVQNSESGLISG